MRRNLCRIGLAVTLALGLMPAAASAETYNYKFRGNVARTAVFGTDSTGCTRTFVTISLFEDRFQEPLGPPEQSAALVISVDQTDYCRGINHFFGVGNVVLPAESLDISRSLQSASLTAVVDVHDLRRDVHASVSIDLEWTGVGDVEHGSSHYQDVYPDYKVVSHSTGSSRNAEVSGTILIGDTNLTTSGSRGFLATNQNGYVNISR